MSESNSLSVNTQKNFKCFKTVLFLFLDVTCCSPLHLFLHLRFNWFSVLAIHFHLRLNLKDVFLTETWIIWTERCWMVCLTDGQFHELLFYILFLVPDSERHLQVWYICQQPALAWEHTSEPEVRGQCYIWGFWQQIQVLKQDLVSYMLYLTSFFTLNCSHTFSCCIMNLLRCHCFISVWTIRSPWCVRHVWTMMARHHSLRPCWLWVESWSTPGLRTAPTWPCLLLKSPSRSGPRLCVLTNTCDVFVS